MRRLLFLTCLGVCFVNCLEQSALADGPPLWKIVGDKSKSDWDALRFNTATGQSWKTDATLVPVVEAGTAPTPGDPGTYDCAVFWPAESSSWFALRWNVRTGQCWLLGSGKWSDFTESGM
jgi:hypothetical protein